MTPIKNINTSQKFLNRLKLILKNHKMKSALFLILGLIFLSVEYTQAQFWSKFE